MESKKIADLLFPSITKTIADLEEEYPKRVIADSAQVTRFAPSPTGFMHIGGIFTALMAERIAHQSDGIFILRVEDTDKAREVIGGVDQIADALRQYDIPTDEGVISSQEQTGPYGPYLQSERKEIYAICAKYLVEQGLAYPCFCTKEELEEIRGEQEKEKVRPGYYGQWAKHRTYSIEQIQQELSLGKPFAIRIKAQSDGKLTFTDEIKGSITMPQNDQDYVLLKSDGLATYHFAHPIDDHFMHVTLVLRGDEWLPSTPLHIQVFNAFNWSLPQFAHLGPIQKIDNGAKRKLSKRKDPEANVTYYTEVGFPKESVKEYLLNIANSNFEDWRTTNPDKPLEDFPFSIKKMNNSGALLDMVKLEDVSKQVISRMSPQTMYELALIWAQTFDTDFANLITQHKEYTINILSIEKDVKGKRKDIAMFSQLRSSFGYFYDQEFDLITKDGYSIPDTVDTQDMKKTMEAYIPLLKTIHEEKSAWFSHIQTIGEALSYTSNTKEYRQHPDQFKGYAGDIAMFLRIALTNRVNTPDLQEIMKVMEEERVHNRLERLISYLK